MLPDVPATPLLDQLSPNGTNGNPAPLTLPPRFRLFAPQYHRVYLTGDYTGAWVDVLLNPGMGLLRDLQTTAGICAHLHQMIRAWNLETPEGQELPVSPASVEQLDPRLSTAIMDAWSAARALTKSG